MKLPAIPDLGTIGLGVGLAAGVAVALYLIARYVNPKEASRAAVNVAGDLTAGAIVGIGEQFGIPNTDREKCDQAIRAGRTFDASKFCPASDFVSYLLSSSTPSSGPVPTKTYGED